MPGETTALAAPAEQCLGLHDQQSQAPGPHAASQQDQQSAVGGRAVDARHTALRHDALLAQQGIFGDQRARDAGQVRPRRHDQASGQHRGLSDRQQVTTEGRGEAAADVTDAMEKRSKQKAGP